MRLFLAAACIYIFLLAPNFAEPKAALLVIDVQQCFCQDGSLHVADASQTGQMIDLINHLKKYGKFAQTIYTKDYHPANHVSFAKPGEAVFSTKDVDHYETKSKKYTQMLWPAHCTQGKQGTDFCPELDVPGRKDLIYGKAYDDRFDSYSVFQTNFDEDTPEGLEIVEKLISSGINEVYVVGLAFDYCVKSSAVHLARVPSPAKKNRLATVLSSEESSSSKAFKVYVVEDATRAVAQGSYDAAKADLEAANVEVVSFSRAMKLLQAAHIVPPKPLAPSTKNLENKVARNTQPIRIVRNN